VVGGSGWVGSESCWVGLGDVKWTHVHLWRGGTTTGSRGGVLLYFKGWNCHW